MNYILYSLSGANPSVIKTCSAETRTMYSNLGKAQILIMGIAAFSAFDVAHNFTKDITSLWIASLGYASVIGIFDYLLLTSPKSHWALIVLRFLVAFCNQIISISAIFVFLNSSTIDNKIAKNRSARLSAIDTIYQKGRDSRWKEYTDKEKSKNEYHKTQCTAQARNGYPGPLFAIIHRNCEIIQADLNEMKARLDEVETPIKKAYEENRQAILNETSNDFFSKLEYLPEVLTKNYMTTIIAICMFLFMFYLETIALLTKIGIPKDNEYVKQQRKYDLDRQEIQRAKDEAKKKDEIAKVELSNKQREAENLIKSFDFSKELQTRILVNEVYQKGMLYLRQKYGFIQGEIILQQQADILNKLNNVKGDEPITIKVDDTENPTGVNEKMYKPKPKGIFQMSKSMIDVVEKIKEFSTDKTTLMRNIYDWVYSNVKYDSDHSLDFYRTAIETFRARRGVCGELSILIITMYKYCEIDSKYLRVTKDNSGKECLHACVGLVQEDGTFQMIDTAFNSFDLQPRHQEFNVVTENQLEQDFIIWNDDNE